MGMAFVGDDADYGKIGGRWRIPVADQCERMFWFGDDVSRSSRNHVPGNAPAKIIGTPVASPGYLTFRARQNFFLTDLLPIESGTFCCVGKSTDTFADNNTNPIFVSDYYSTTVDGATIQGQLTTKKFVGVTALTTSGTPVGDTIAHSGTPPLADAWTLAFFTFSAAGQTLTLFNSANTGGSELTESFSSSTRRVATQPLAFGSDPFTGTGRGTCQMAMAGAWSRVLTLSERQTMYAAIKSICLHRGISGL